MFTFSGAATSATSAAAAPVALQIIESSAAGSSLGNGITYVPLVKSAADWVELQIRPQTAGTIKIRITYFMSAANGGNVRLQVSSAVIAVAADPTASLVAGTAFSITPGSNTNIQAVTESDSTDLSLTVTAGGVARIRLTRVADGNDTHTGDIRLIDITAVHV